MKNKCIVFEKVLLRSLHLKKKKSKQPFQRPIPVVRPRAFHGDSNTTLVSVFTQPYCSDRTAGCSAPAARGLPGELCPPSEHLHSAFCVCVCVCRLTLRGSILPLVIAIVYCILFILLVAALNCHTACGLQGLTGQISFVLLAVPKSAIYCITQQYKSY